MAMVPTIEEEDAKRPNRERENLVGERSRIVNRMKSCLARLGIRNFKATLRKAPERGVSTGDFEAALIALLGKDAGGLSASTVSRLKEAWSEEHARWSKRDLSASATCTSGPTALGASERPFL